MAYYFSQINQSNALEQNNHEAVNIIYLIWYSEYHFRQKLWVSLKNITCVPLIETENIDISLFLKARK